MMNTRLMTPSLNSMTSRAALLVAGTVLFAACGKEKEAVANTAPTVQTIGPDNIAVVSTDTLRSGPAISGTLVADREARIRAEVSGAVLADVCRCRPARGRR
jgi:multidrug efflux pump subunit AcrA (membrane-fusion protein)